MTWLERRRERRKRLKPEQMLGLANYLTYGRIAMVPVFILLLYLISPADQVPRRSDIILSWVTLGLFVLSGLSDIVDGYIARRWNTSSVFGKFLDPLADKLLSATFLIMLIPLRRVAAWIVVLLICREIAVTAIRGMAAAEGVVIAASEWGKRKTVMMSCALGALIIHYPFWGVDPHLVGTVLIYFTVIISLGSGIHYIWSFLAEILQRQKPASLE